MRTIIIAEDELLLRCALVKLIGAHCDFQVVHEAANGQAALEFLRQHHTDILLTDIRMVKMDGLELLEHIKDENIQTKTIVISGYGDFEYAQKALRFGAVDYLLKPASPEELYNALEKASLTIALEEVNRNAQKNAVLQALKNGEMQLTPSLQASVNGSLKSGAQVFSCCVLFMDFCDCQTMSLLSEAVDAQFHGSYSSYADNRLLLLAPYHSEDKSMELAQLLQEYLSSLGYTCAIGVGCASQALEFASQSLQQAEQAVLHSCSNHAGILHFDTLASSRTQNEPYPLEQERLVLKAVTETDFAKTQKAVESFLGVISSYSRIRVLHIVQELCFSMRRELFQYGVSIDVSPLLKSIKPQTGTNALQALLLCSMREWNSLLHRDYAMSYEKIAAFAKEYIDAHAFEKIGLDDVCNACFVSKSQLCKIFKTVTGTTFKNYLNDLRVQHARILLQTTSLRSYEVAQQLGFEDTSYFGEIFKKQTGKTPAEYKKSLKTGSSLRSDF